MKAFFERIIKRSPWCDSFTFRSSDYALFQTCFFTYTVLVIGLGRGSSDPALWGLSLPRPWVSYWGIGLMISLKLAMGSITEWCARIRPKWRKFPMISISWSPYLTPSYIPEEPLNRNIAWHLICCGFFFLDSQGEFPYSPSHKKQRLITHNHTTHKK